MKFYALSFLVLSMLSIAQADSVILHPGDSIRVGGKEIACTGGGSSGASIKVTYARYYTDEHTTEARNYCLGRSYCAIDPTALWSDPAEGTEKGFVVRYVCLEDGMQRGGTREEKMFPVRTGSVVELRCD